MMKKIKLGIFLVFGLALCWILTPTNVLADSIYVNGWNGQNVVVSGYSGLAVEFDFTITPTAGPPAYRAAGYCYEFGQYISQGGPFYNYTITPIVAGDALALRKAGEIVERYAPGQGYTGYVTEGLTINQARTAVQLAVWELKNETLTTTPYNLLTGNFLAITAEASVIAAANRYLGVVGSAFLGSYTAISTANQDFIISKVPIPGAVWLLGSGLLGLLGFKRKFVG